MDPIVGDSGDFVYYDEETNVAETTTSPGEVSQATLDTEASLYKWNLWMGICHFS